MPKDSYGECERLNHYVCEEVYVVEISLGESGYWWRDIVMDVSTMRHVHFGKLKILLCVVLNMSSHAKQTPEFHWVTAS